MYIVSLYEIEVLDNTRIEFMPVSIKMVMSYDNHDCRYEVEKWLNGIITY